MGLVNHLMISHTWNIKGGESKHTFELLSLTVDRNTLKSFCLILLLGSWSFPRIPASSSPTCLCHWHRDHQKCLACVEDTDTLLIKKKIPKY